MKKKKNQLILLELVEIHLICYDECIRQIDASDRQELSKSVVSPKCMMYSTSTTVQAQIRQAMMLLLKSKCKRKETKYEEILLSHPYLLLLVWLETQQSVWPLCIKFTLSMLDLIMSNFLVELFAGDPVVAVLFAGDLAGDLCAVNMSVPPLDFPPPRPRPPDSNGLKPHLSLDIVEL